MEFKDNKGKILAMLIDFDSINEEKYFATDNDNELQIATFNLKKEQEILRHIHPPQDRKINTTSEVLIVLEGEIEFTLYDDDLELCHSAVAKKGNLLVLMSGGHGLKILQDTKFIEVKQGPYDEKIDKVRF